MRSGSGQREQGSPAATRAPRAITSDATDRDHRAARLPADRAPTPGPPRIPDSQVRASAVRRPGSLTNAARPGRGGLAPRRDPVHRPERRAGRARGEGRPAAGRRRDPRHSSRPWSKPVRHAPVAAAAIILTLGLFLLVDQRRDAAAHRLDRRRSSTSASRSTASGRPWAARSSSPSSTWAVDAAARLGPAGPREPAPCPPRTPGSYRVALVCLGNICRSPMADVVLSRRVDRRRPRRPGPRALGRHRRVARRRRRWTTAPPPPCSPAATTPARHRAQQCDAGLRRPEATTSCWPWTSEPRRPRRPRRRGAPRRALRLFRDLDPVDPGGDVPDPYYGGDDGFEEVLVDGGAHVRGPRRRAAGGRRLMPGDR